MRSVSKHIVMKQTDLSLFCVQFLLVLYCVFLCIELVVRFSIISIVVCIQSVGYVLFLSLRNVSVDSNGCNIAKQTEWNCTMYNKKTNILEIASFCSQAQISTVDVKRGGTQMYAAHTKPCPFHWAAKSVARKCRPPIRMHITCVDFVLAVSVVVVVVAL